MRVLKAVLFALVCALILWASGIAPALIPSNVPAANKRGNSNVFQLASNNSAAAAGTVFCDDGNGNTAPCAAGTTIDSSGNFSTPAGVFTGVGSGQSGVLTLSGATSGGASWASPAIGDASKTAYLMPTASGTGNFLQDTGSTTCPTFAAGGPTTCHGTAWMAGGATGPTGPTGPTGSGGSGAANASCTFALAATGCATPTSIDVSAMAAASINQFLVQCFTGASTTQTPVTILTAVYTTGSGIIQTIAPTFASAGAAGYCVVNGSGTGATGPTGPTGPTGGGGGGSVPYTGWTVVNSAQLSNFAGANFVGVGAVDSASLNWRLVTRPVTVPYTLTATFSCSMANLPVNTQDCGAYISDGTKLIGIEMLSQNLTNGVNQLRVERINSVTSDNSTVAGPTSGLISNQLWTIKIANDGTTRTFSYYKNGAFVSFFSEAAGSFLTETVIGFGALSAASNTTASANNTLLYWSGVP